MVDSRLLKGVCVSVVVLLVFVSIGAAQQRMDSWSVQDDAGNEITEAEIEASMGSGYRKAGAIAGGVLMGIVGGVLIAGKAFVYEGWELDRATSVVGAVALEGGGILLGYGIGKEYDRRKAIDRIKAQRRGQEEPSRSSALLQIERRRLCFSVPSLAVRPIVLCEGAAAWEYRIELVGMRF